MTDLKNKISIFRDLLDFAPCSGSATATELLILTLDDIFKLHPLIKPDLPVSKIEGASMHKALTFFCDAMKSLGALWTTDEWMVKCKYDSKMKLEHGELEKIVIHKSAVNVSKKSKSVSVQGCIFNTAYKTLKLSCV